MTAPAVPAADSSLEERLDLLGAQVSFLVDEVRRQREQRDRWAELTHDLAPLARQAMGSAARELEEIDVSLEDVTHLSRTVLASLPSLEAALRQVNGLAELARDVAPLSTLAVGALTDRLQALEEKGYFAFARQGLGVIDRIVTTYGEDDVRALADNVVLILDTVKEMTQPEVMNLLSRTINVVQDEEPAEPPSLFALLKEMRDPSVRRGLARMLTLLRSVGTDSPAAGARLTATRR
jgi:uncharacterized protein YjgD (DUF1641 family)